MRRLICISLTPMLFVMGCAKPDLDMSRPPVPAEMAKLEPWLGTWTGSAEMVSPTREQLESALGEDAAKIPTSFKGEETFERYWDGMFIRQEGWHSMDAENKARYVMYICWDPKARKFRQWYFSDYGEYGSGWMRLKSDGKTWSMEGTSTDAKGKTRRGTGTARFTSDDTMEWTWGESSLFGGFKMKGTSKRVAK